MDRKVIWTGPALADLDSAAEFIEADSPLYAAAFVQHVLDAAESLSNLADRGQQIPEYPSPGLRELLVHPYRIIYEIKTQEVHIIALVHAARRAWRF